MPASPFKKARPGNAVEAQLVEEHLRLVKTVVSRLAMQMPPQVDIEDLYSSGLVGLLNAVRNYDPKGGSSFESYARVRIRGAIIDELRSLDWIPRSIHDKAGKIRGVVVELEQTHSRPPTDTEVAERLGISVEEYEEIKIEIRTPTMVCIDLPAFNFETTDIEFEGIRDDRQEDPSVATAQRELCDIITTKLEYLPDMHRKVLALYYFEDYRLREIGRMFDVTESRISQLHTQGLELLREQLQGLN